METISRFVDQRIRVVSVSVESILTRDTVQRALESCRKGKRDFADSLIGHVNLARACRHTATFDKALTATPGFRLL